MINLLLYFGAINVIAICSALALGYMGPSLYLYHFAFGFLGALSATLWIGVAMFYIIYTGYAANNAFKAGLATEERRMYISSSKMRLFPWYTVNILLLIAGPFLGASVQASTASKDTHSLVAWIAVVAYTSAVALSWNRLKKHGEFINELVEIIKKRREEKKGKDQENQAGPQDNGSGSQ